MNDTKSTKKVSGIYKIVNTIDGKYYVGSSDNILGVSGRWKEHVNDLRANRHCNSYLQRAWNKYGESSFELVIVEEIPKKHLVETEQKHLDLAKPQFHKQSYNLSFCASGGGGMIGHKHSKKSKLQTSKKLKGRISPNKGLKHPEYSGEKHPKCDLRVFTFNNMISREVYTGTRYSFCSKYNLHRVPINRLIQKKSKSSQGWMVVR